MLICRCAGDKTSDRLIDGLADKTIAAESLELIYRQLERRETPATGPYQGAGDPLTGPRKLRAPSERLVSANT